MDAPMNAAPSLSLKPMVSVRGLSKAFGVRRALYGVGFDVIEGEILGLIGPNGAGKTTLLECLAGLLRADAGRVEAGGRALSAGERKGAIFYLPDGVRPGGGARAGETLDFFRVMHGRSPADARRAAQGLSLDGILGDRVEDLSKGTLKRFLLALALLAPQRLLLLDEPFDGLDPRQTRGVIVFLKGLQAGGRTLLLSIHQLTDAEKICDRFLLLDEGRSVGEGSTAELRRRAKLDAGSLEDIFLALT